MTMFEDFVEDPPGSGLYIHVAPATGWLDLDDARLRWADAPEEDDILTDLLDVAREAVLAYAPLLAEGAEIPTSYRMAQQMQMKAIWTATVGEGGGLGPDGFVIVPKPLDWNIRQLLRPRTGVPTLA
jgi:hypothetical protein